MSKKLKKKLKRIIIALSAFLLLMLADKVILPLAFDKNLATVIDGKYGWTLAFGLFLGVYVYIGYDVLRKAAVNIAHGQVFDENFLMVIATLGAFALAICRGLTGQEVEGFDEACAVLLFYQVGEWFQSYAVGKSRKDIASLMDVRPDYANLVTADGVTKVDPSSVNVGDLIVVKPGEKIPLDGEIVEGRTSLDAKALTGESAPIDAHEGETVISGCVNISGTVKVKDRKFYNQVRKILYAYSRGRGGASGDNTGNNNKGLCHVGIQGTFVFGSILSVCARYIDSARIFCRHRRSIEKGYSHKGQQLPGKIRCDKRICVR